MPNRKYEQNCNPLGPLQETAPAVIMRPIEGGF